MRRMSERATLKKTGMVGARLLYMEPLSHVTELTISKKIELAAKFIRHCHIFVSFLLKYIQSLKLKF
jgi:hypothetical protein